VCRQPKWSESTGYHGRREGRKEKKEEIEKKGSGTLIRNRDTYFFQQKASKVKGQDGRGRKDGPEIPLKGHIAVSGLTPIRRGFQRPDERNALRDGRGRSWQQVKSESAKRSCFEGGD